MGHRFERSDLTAALIALIATSGFALAGGPEALGAHPWWAVKVGLWGAGAGLTLWFALRLSGLKGAALFGVSALVLLSGIAMAWIGKMRFAVSFAEDTLAGRSWYFGWIVLMTGAFLVIAAAWRGRKATTKG